MTHMSEIIDLLKITIVNCKFMQLSIYCKYICVHGFDSSTNSISLKIGIHVHFMIMHVVSNRFKEKILVFANLCNMQFLCKYICAHGFD